MKVCACLAADHSDASAPCASVPLQSCQRGFKRHLFRVSREVGEDDSPADDPPAPPAAPGETSPHQPQTFIWNVRTFRLYEITRVSAHLILFYSASHLGAARLPTDDSINCEHEILIDRFINSKFTGRHEPPINSYMRLSLFCVIGISGRLTHQLTL